jgi:hypothetical protein
VASLRTRTRQDETLAIRPLAARAALAPAARLHGLGRQRLAIVWYPLRVFGLIYAGMAAAVLIVHRNHLAPYSLVTLLVGSALTARHYHRSGEADGVVTSPWLWLATSIAMTIGGAIASVTGFALHSRFLDSTGPFLVVTASFAASGAVTRSRLLLRDAHLMLAVCAAATAIPDGNDRVAVQAAGFATILLVSATFQRRRLGLT